MSLADQLTLARILAVPVVIVLFVADFVILSEDPHTIDPETIKDITIARTVVGGNTVYEV